MTAPAPAYDLAALRADVGRLGLLERQPLYYVWKAGSTLLLLGLAWVALAHAEGALLLCLAAVGAGFAYCQVGLLAHDAAHHQISSSPERDRRLALLLFNGVVGLSLGWWLDKHNRHHGHPNRDGRDPDVAPVFLAYAEHQAARVRGRRRWIVRYQALLLLPLLLLEGFNLRYQSFAAVVRGASPYPRAERALMALHFLAYLALSVWLLGAWGALAFVAVHHMAMGMYLGLVFLPNHTGMPVLELGADADYVSSQVLTTRNLRSGPLVDFLYGGLNRQIEHHLFPTMPRNRLVQAARHVRRLCDAHGIPYREVGVVAAYREVFRGLHRAGRPLRAPVPSSPGS